MTTDKRIILKRVSKETIIWIAFSKGIPKGTAYRSNYPKFEFQKVSLRYDGTLFY